MDIAWIQVFVLTLAECVAPAGKSICQEQEFELQFLTKADCEFALEQLVSLKQESEKVIVNSSRSNCASAARERNVFESLDAINKAFDADWEAPQAGETESSAKRVSHQGRLEDLKSCEETDGVTPCKIGEIIIEGADGDPVDVWRRD
ncbi:MAG: hypothetical protein GWP02_02325 [Desulfobulbaceae bacterium]|nr:hypothetical protein [Desulfobulbaceae bacterium]